MKILAGACLLTEPLCVHTLHREKEYAPFRSLNDIRLYLSNLDFIQNADLSDFGRGSVSVKMALLSALFAVNDLGHSLPEDTGVYGWNGCGCTAENIRYWQDYEDNLRESGRGSLFVGTLPTIPYGETAIALRLHGASCYLQTVPSVKQLLKMLSVRPNFYFMIGELWENEACMMIMRQSGQNENDTDLLPDFHKMSELFFYVKRNLSK